MAEPGPPGFRCDENSARSGHCDGPITNGDAAPLETCLTVDRCVRCGITGRVGDNVHIRWRVSVGCIRVPRAEPGKVLTVEETLEEFQVTLGEFVMRANDQFHSREFTQG